MGIFSFSRFVSADPASGFGAKLDVIAAAAIGGASLSFGVGNMAGAIIGAALAGIITNGVVLLNIAIYAQRVITGCAILIAVSIDIWRVRFKGTPLKRLRGARLALVRRPCAALPMTQSAKPSIG